MVSASPILGLASESALAAGRKLCDSAPQAVALKGGDAEGWQFWEANEALLARAWQEYGKRAPEVYHFQRRHLAPAVDEALGDMAAMRRQLQEVIPGEYALRYTAPEAAPGTSRVMMSCIRSVRIPTATARVL